MNNIIADYVRGLSAVITPKTDNSRTKKKKETKVKQKD
jgi:hypothetical protein